MKNRKSGKAARNFRIGPSGYRLRSFSDFQLIENNKGSSGRTRTYNPPVNRPIKELLPLFAGLCFKLLPCAFPQKTNELTSCFYLPQRALSCFELRPVFGKNLAKLSSPAASPYPPNSAAKDARTGAS